MNKNNKQLKLRVFLSSVMEDYESFRAAARRGVELAGGEPVMLEDFPSIAASSRNACLDGVDSCDVLVILIGSRGGWKAPSGKLVVEEEYEEAKRLNMPILAFLQNTDRDESSMRLASLISDYIEGVYRKIFSNTNELEQLVEKSLTPIIQNYRGQEMNTTVIDQLLENPYKFNTESGLRIVFLPERQTEFIDPVSLEDQQLIDELYKIGHSSEVRLLNYEYPKSLWVEVNEIVIIQDSSELSRDTVDNVSINLATTGMITIDTNISGRHKNDSHSYLFCISEEDIAQVLNRMFAFVKEIYKLRDPYKRHCAFFYNVCLNEISSKMLVKKIQPRSSFPIPMDRENIIKAFDSPRKITREFLSNSEQEVGRILSLLRRRIGS
jgi:hypothetical protein